MNRYGTRGWDEYPDMINRRPFSQQMADCAPTNFTVTLTGHPADKFRLIGRGATIAEAMARLNESVQNVIERRKKGPTLCPWCGAKLLKPPEPPVPRETAPMTVALRHSCECENCGTFQVFVESLGDP
jgi:hypothetical protein